MHLINSLKYRSEQILKVKIDNIEKYTTALNNLIGMDSAYFTGDEDVDTLVELINIANQQQAEINRLQKQLEYCEDEGEYWESKYKNAKIEGYKEFADSLISELNEYYCEECQIDTLIKERLQKMKGEE
jgi:hypothetical protein